MVLIILIILIYNPSDQPVPDSHMYVCLCNGVTDRQLIEAATQGASESGGRVPAEQIADRLGAGLGCGSCREFALDIVERATATHQAPVVLSDGTGSRASTPHPTPILSYRFGLAT